MCFGIQDFDDPTNKDLIFDDVDFCKFRYSEQF